MPTSAFSPTLLDRSVARSSSANVATPVRAGAVALAVGLTAAAAQFATPLPFTAVPFTFTPMAVLLTGAVLGRKLGGMAEVCYVLAGAAGLAVFSPSATLLPGILRLAGPTGGYIMAYPLAAFVAGWLSERGWDRRYVTSFLAMSAGLVVIYAGGLAWLVAGLHVTPAAAFASGVVPFLLLDILKLVAASAILPQAWKLVGPASS